MESYLTAVRRPGPVVLAYLNGRSLGFKESLLVPINR